MSRRRVAIVPHTHWDREWYEPFQTFRIKLVATLDALVPLLESDPSYARFLLDGQLAAVDDYLEVRPEAEERVRALASSGRLTMGPWYTLMDEFLVSGETIVRDLQMGMRRAAAFGGAMDVGYLPDMFGHVAQMPQILRLAGLEHAVVWRGVPSAVTKTAFSWEALDGSTVRAEYLPVGYGSGALLPDDAKALVRRVADLEQEIGPFLIGPLLLMNGSDHLAPQPWLGRVVAEANAAQDDYLLEITSLPEYLADAPTDGLEHWKGELRSGARANVLMGVTSNRVDVKQAAAAAERALEQRAEPFAALFLPAADWPSRLLDLAWLGVVRNAAHDSVCACSVDDVVDAVLHRYAESRQIADAVASRGLDGLARSMSDPGAVVVNASAHPRGGLVELVVGSEVRDGHDIQLLSTRFDLPGSMTLDAQAVRTILGMLQGPKIGDDAWVHDVRVDEDDTGIGVTVTLGPEERPDVPIAEAKQDLYARLGARPDAMVRIRLDQPPIRRVLARSAEVPGFGWRSFTPATLAHPVTVQVVAPGGADGLQEGAVVLSNGLVTVAVDPRDGTFSVDGLPGFGRLVDGGDLGDSYNYSPPGRDTVVDTPESVAVTAGETGPVRGTAVTTATYRWPDHVDGASQSRVGEQLVEVATTVELHADEPVVRVSTTFVNPSRDHRVRVLLALPEPASESEAGSAFAAVRRGLTAEGRSDEHGLPTFPSRRFVSAGGLTVVHDGVVEYELVDIEPSTAEPTATATATARTATAATAATTSSGDGDGGAASTGAGAGPAPGSGPPRAHALALTVLRATGMLSRLGMAYRPLPAGPLTPVEGLQLVGRRVQAAYALAVGPVDPWALADDVLVPLEVVNSLGGGSRPPRGSALEVAGAEVTAVRRQAGVLEVRVFNPSSAPSTVTVGMGSGWLVDLRGRPIAQFDGSFELRGFGIATVHLPGA